MRKNYVIFLLTIFLTSTGYCQITEKIQEVIDSHKANAKSLYNYRGAPQSWLTTENVNTEHLFQVVESYSNNVGLVIYTYQRDTLNIKLISNLDEYFRLESSRSIQTVNKKIDATVLEDLINAVNANFSSAFLHRSPVKRGAQPVSKENDDQEFRKNLVDLNKLLLPKELGLERLDHIIFVPTLNIATLPFSAFKVQNEFLIDRMSYSIAPSLFELMFSKDKTSEMEGQAVEYFWENALFVANPQYPDNLEWDFPNLPGAEEEVEYIIEAATPERYVVYKGENAIKEKILNNLCEFDLLYFATHGISDAEEPMDKSYLVLAEDETSSPFFTLREIMNTRHTCELKADLVVLSACQTGLGRSHEGGVIGLARAFQIAGANHVLMSLWNIDDKETATIMKMFFDSLSEAKTLMPHAALRQAILKYKKEVNPDPRYWAAFSIFGVPY